GAGTLLALSAGLEVQNATVQNSTIQGPGSVPSSTLFPYTTLFRSVPVTVNDANTLTVRNGLTLNGAVLTLADLAASGNTTAVNSSGKQTPGRPGQAELAGNSPGNFLQSMTGTLTIGSGLTVHGTQG